MTATAGLEQKDSILVSMRPAVVVVVTPSDSRAPQRSIRHKYNRRVGRSSGRHTTWPKDIVRRIAGTCLRTPAVARRRRSQRAGLSFVGRTTHLKDTYRRTTGTYFHTQVEESWWTRRC